MSWDYPQQTDYKQREYKDLEPVKPNVREAIRRRTIQARKEIRKTTTHQDTETSSIQTVSTNIFPEPQTPLPPSTKPDVSASSTESKSSTLNTAAQTPSKVVASAPVNMDLRTMALKGLLTEADIQQKLAELKAEKNDFFTRLKKLQQR